MRVLIALAGVLLLAAIVPPTQPVAGTPPTGPTVPPNSTDHGVNATLFPLLWSGDIDDPNRSTAGAVETLAARTDVPFDRPPAAVEQWNRGDHGEFPTTNASVSVQPTDAAVTNSTVIVDAYTAVFAVQPSTRARLSPGDQPHYIAPNGTVRATVDYRLDPPTYDTATVEWAHRIETVRLLVDDTVVATTNGTHTPTLTYAHLDRFAATSHTLTVEAEIVATPTVTARDCGGDEESCPPLNVSADRVTVRDSMPVTVYELSVSGFRAAFPDGDTGLVLYKSRPWLGYELPGGDVRGVWRFYTARDTAWDELVYRTDDGTRRTASPLVPLRTYAYPIETGPTPSPRDTVTIRETYGEQKQPPTLPPTVNLDVLTEPYTASYGLATHVDASASARPITAERLRALGLVRGVSVTPDERYIDEVDIARANLTLTVHSRTAETVTVRARLTAAETGEPIATNTRGGAVVIAGERLNTTANGTVTTTVPRGQGSVAARYDPGRWWRVEQAYTAASDVVYVGGTVIRIVRVLYQVAVPVALFLGAVFITDRFTGWQLWPPWRGL